MLQKRPRKDTQAGGGKDQHLPVPPSSPGRAIKSQAEEAPQPQLFFAFLKIFLFFPFKKIPQVS